MLLLGGFAIAAALSKHFIAKQLAVAILSRVGRRPQHVLLANMLVATFASMWISNVAAPVLCFSLVQPILRTLKTHHPFSKSLVIGIALASNLGGMTSPISSPQNIFAIERMSMGGTPPSWLQWFAVALPVSVLGNLLCWALILAVYRPGLNIKEVGCQTRTVLCVGVFLLAVNRFVRITYMCVPHWQWVGQRAAVTRFRLLLPAHEGTSRCSKHAVGWCLERFTWAVEGLNGKLLPFLKVSGGMSKGTM